MKNSADHDRAAEQGVVQIGKDTFLFSMGNVSIKAVTFLLIPLYTHYLSVQEVGAYVLLELAEMFYSYIGPLGVPSAIFRFFYRHRSSGKEKAFIASNFYFLLLANLIGLTILYFLAGYLVPIFLPGQVGSLSLLRLYFLALFFGFSRNFLLTVLRAYSRSGLFVVVSLFQSILFVLLNLYLIAYQGMGLKGFVLAKIFSSGMVFLLTWGTVLAIYGFRFQHRFVTETLTYGLPLIAHGLSLLVLAMSDRYIIKELVSVEAAGVYGIAYKFGMILNMIFVSPFLLAWNPMLFRLENRPEQKLAYQKTALYFVQIAMVLWLFVSVAGKYLIWWTTTPDYYPGIVIVPFIAFSYVLYGLQGVFSAGALLANKTRHITLLGVVAALLNIGLNFLLIPQFLYLGAAVATVLSYFLLTVAIYILSQSYFPIQWLWRKMALVSILALMVYGLSFWPVANQRLGLVKDGAGVLLFMILLFRFKLVSFSEVRRFVTSLRTGRFKE